MALGGKLLGLIAGGALARALGVTVEPAVENVRQDAWKENPIGVLDSGTIGALLAKEMIDPGAAEEQLARQGLSGDKTAYLKEVNQTVPGEGIILELLRRGFISYDDAILGEKVEAMRPEFQGWALELKDAILSPADLANAVQQGFIPNAGLLPGLVAGETDITIPVDEVDIDTLKEFAGAGLDDKHAKVLAELVGLPPGPMELLQMLNRGIISDESYYVGIREGHTKTKWANALKALRNAILTPIEGANLYLRKWITQEEMYSIGALSGMSSENMDLLYKMQGRPPGPGQAQTAYNRGLITRDQFDQMIAQSDVRTEWTDVEFELRRRYPTVFVLRSLVSTGALTAAEGESILLIEGFPPDLASKIATAWAAGKTAKQKELAQSAIDTLYESRYIDGAQAIDLLTRLGYDGTEITLILELGDARRVKRFLDTAIGRIHTKFVSHILPEQEALTELQALNISSQAVSDLMAEWKLERDVNAPVLTVGEWASAAFYAVVPVADAIAQIVARGYTQREAEIMVYTRLHGIPQGATLT